MKVADDTSRETLECEWVNWLLSLKNEALISRQAVMYLDSLGSKFNKVNLFFYLSNLFFCSYACTPITQVDKSNFQLTLILLVADLANRK